MCIRDRDDVDAVVVPVGGGGLISGVAAAIKELKPSCKIYGVQAAGAPSMYESIRAHEKKALETVDTFADGIAVKVPGDNTYELVNKYVDEMITVTEDEIEMCIRDSGSIAANRAVDRADLLIALGCRFSDRVALNPEKFARRAKKVQVDIDKSEINKNVLVDKSVISDVKDFLQKLSLIHI